MSITTSTLSLTRVAYFNVIKTITEYLARKYGTFEREASASSLLGDRQGKALTNCHRNRSFPVNSLYSNQSEVMKSQLSRKRQMSIWIKPEMVAHIHIPSKMRTTSFSSSGLISWATGGRGAVETPYLCIHHIGGGTAEYSKVRSECLDIASILILGIDRAPKTQTPGSAPPL
jgi:hypothetical protein